MEICYDGLWKVLIDNKMKKTDLIECVGISPSTLAKLGKDEFVKLETITKIALYFNLQLSDVTYICECEEKDNA